MQCGTCLIFDVMTSDTVYKGGSISLCFRMRFKALKHFTSHLPLISLDKDVKITGSSTSESIQSGVFNGFCAECNGIIKKYSSDYKELIIILSGGDYEFVKEDRKSVV